MKPVVGFLVAVTGLVTFLLSLVDGSYMPWLPIGVTLLLGGVLLLVSGQRAADRREGESSRRAGLLDRLQRVRRGVEAVRALPATEPVRVDSLIKLTELELDILRELGWEHEAERVRYSLDQLQTYRWQR